MKFEYYYCLPRTNFSTNENRLIIVNKHSKPGHFKIQENYSCIVPQKYRRPCMKFEQQSLWDNYKVDMTKQNQDDFRIQCIQIVLNQLSKNLDTELSVDQFYLL